MKSNAIPRAAAVLAVFAMLAASPAAAQFEKYVALGDSITASFQGLCLVTRHQNASYPLLVSQQLGISDFQQPLFAEGTLTAGPAPKCLGFVVNGNAIGVGPVSDQLQPTNLGLGRPYDNLGIPGATAGELISITSADPNGNTANKFAYAILRNNGPIGNPLNGTNAIQQAASLQPDLTTLWVGSNDVLGALLYAIAIDGVTLTPVVSFNQSYTQIVQTIASTGSTLVTLNIPDVGSVPFANTIPPVVVDPSTGQPLIFAGQTVALLGPGNDAFPCPGGAPACPMPAGTLVTLSAQPLLQSGVGIPCAVATLPQCNTPLPDGQFIPPATIVPGVVLYPDEVARIRTRTDELNGVIATVGASAGAIPLDIHAFFSGIAEHGYHVGGLTLTTTFGTGGIFSADGFHPNDVGQAVIAAEIINLLNSARDLAIPLPNLGEALFTPDLPPGGGTLVTGPGMGLSEEMQRQLYGMFPPVGSQVQVLERVIPIRRPEPRDHTGKTRTVERPGDRNQ